jgi:WD40 repeat protein
MVNFDDIPLEDQEYVLNLPNHLAQARMTNEYFYILVEFEFIDFKITKAELQNLIEDYNFISNKNLDLTEEQNKILLLIQKSIQLSQNTLIQYKNQLASQLFGRLQHFNIQKINNLLKQAKQSQKSWLRPLTSTLNSPNTQLIRTLITNYDGVEILAISPDAKKVISDSKDRFFDLKVWELETGIELFSFKENFLTITSDSKLISVPYYPNNNNVKIRDLKTRQNLFTLIGHKKVIETVRVTPDNKQLISVSKDRIVKRWDLTTGQELDDFAIFKDNNLDTFIIAPDCSKLITFNRNFIGVWDIIKKQQLFYLNYVNQVFIKKIITTSNSQKLICLLSNRTLQVYDLQTGKTIFNFSDSSHKDFCSYFNILSATFDNKKLIANLGDQTLKVWNLETGLQLFTLVGHHLPITTLAVTSDSKQFISGSADKTIKVWSSDTGEEILTLKGHSGIITALAITPNRKQLVSAANDHTVKVWNLNTNSQLFEKHLVTYTNHNEMVTELTVTPNGKQVISGSADNTLKIWDIQSGNNISTLLGHNEPINMVITSSDGKIIVSASVDHRLKVWDLEKQVELFTLMFQQQINLLIITTNNKYFIVVLTNKNIKIFDLKTGEELCQLQGIFFAFNSHTDQIFYQVDNKNIKVYDLKIREESFTLYRHNNSISDLIITPHNKQIISASRDKTIKVWDLKTGKKIWTFSGHKGVVYGIIVTPDNKKLISCSEDKTIKVWCLETGLELLTLLGHKKSVIGVTITAFGKQILSFSQDENFKVWNLEIGVELFNFNGFLIGSNIREISGQKILNQYKNSKYIIIRESRDDKHTIKVCDLLNRNIVGNFTVDSSIFCTNLGLNGEVFIAGDELGVVHFLRLESIDKFEADRLK